jgi:hypothetical protein
MVGFLRYTSEADSQLATLFTITGTYTTEKSRLDRLHSGPIF